MDDDWGELPVPYPTPEEARKVREDGDDEKRIETGERGVPSSRSRERAQPAPAPTHAKKAKTVKPRNPPKADKYLKQIAKAAHPDHAQAKWLKLVVGDNTRIHC